MLTRKVLPAFLFASLFMLTLTGCPRHHDDHHQPPPSRDGSHDHDHDNNNDHH